MANGEKTNESISFLRFFGTLLRRARRIPRERREDAQAMVDRIQAIEGMDAAREVGEVSAALFSGDYDIKRRAKGAVRIAVIQHFIERKFTDPTISEGDEDAFFDGLVDFLSARGEIVEAMTGFYSGLRDKSVEVILPSRPGAPEGGKGATPQRKPVATTT